MTQPFVTKINAENIVALQDLQEVIVDEYV